MTLDDFDKQLHAHIRRKPFQPFIVALMDGRRYLIAHPSMAFNGTAAAHLSETEGLIDFAFDEVDHFEALTLEPTT